MSTSAPSVAAAATFTAPVPRVRRMTTSGVIALCLGAAAILAIALMPWWASRGLMRDIVMLCCYIAVAQMWNLLAGYGGLVSVGQQAFIGVGAYVMFLLAQDLGVNPFLASGLCVIAPAILAVPVYALVKRLDGPYFAIGTWVVAEVFRLIATNLSIVNGGAGMSLRVMTQYSFQERAVGTALLAAALLLVTIGGSYLLLRSRHGLALTAMRDNPVAAASQGVDVGRMRFMIYLAAAVGSGFAGAVYFMAQLRITPASAFDTSWANLSIFIVMVGGIGSIEGVLIGAMIYFFADQWFGQYGPSYMIVLGLLTLLTALFFRSGLWGQIRRVVDLPWFPTQTILVQERKGGR